MAKTDLLKEAKTILAQDTDFLKTVVQKLFQELLEAEMSETLGVSSYGRSGQRQGYRAGYYSRQLGSQSTCVFQETVKANSQQSFLSATSAQKRLY